MYQYTTVPIRFVCFALWKNQRQRFKVFLGYTNTNQWVYSFFQLYRMLADKLLKVIGKLAM